MWRNNMNIYLISWEQYMNPGYDRHIYLGPYSFVTLPINPIYTQSLVYWTQKMTS